MSGKIYTCSVCNKPYKNERSFYLHKDSHNSYTCDICSKVFWGKHCLRVHKKTHQKNKVCNYICNVCGLKFVNISVLKKHQDFHNDYICDICDKKYKGKEGLFAHKKTHETKYQCELCGFCFFTNSGYKYHIDCHVEYECSICRVKVEGKLNLEGHIQRYHNDNVRSANSSGFRNHLAFIINPDAKKMFICEFCGLQFENDIKLRTHKKKHDIIYYCDVCGVGFRKKQGYIYHLDCHIEYECSICKVKVEGKLNLKAHVQRYHTNEFQQKQISATNVIKSNMMTAPDTQRVATNIPLDYNKCSICLKIIIRGNNFNQTPFICQDCHEKGVVATSITPIHSEITNDEGSWTLNGEPLAETSNDMLCTNCGCGLIDADLLDYHKSYLCGKY